LPKLEKERLGSSYKSKGLNRNRYTGIIKLSKMLSYLQPRKNLPEKEPVVLKNKNTMRTTLKLKDYQGFRDRMNLIHRRESYIHSKERSLKLLLPRGELSGMQTIG
jgi:hypothetical protein